MLIQSENKLVQQQLKFIAKTVVEHGGTIHPELTITHQTERLWISCSAEVDGSALLIIPDELFIPVTHLEWAGENGVLSYTGDNSQLTPVQQSLLDAMVSLYNATDKITQVAQRLPAQLLPDDPDLLNWLMDAQPAFELPKITPARQFIQTRLNEKPKKNDDEGKSIGYLMPLIDLLNHHPYGPKYQRTEQGDWLIALDKTNMGSDDCYVRYGKSDSLSLTMWHGYYEPNTRYLACLDCEIQHTVLGTVKIIGTNASRRKINAPRLLPEESVLTLQDLVLEREQLPALRTLLGLAVRSKLRNLNQAQAEIMADEIIALLVGANIEKYMALQAICAEQTENFPLRQMFGQVAEHQLSLLSAFKL